MAFEVLRLRLTIREYEDLFDKLIYIHGFLKKPENKGK
jgi:hypothetical protein